MATIRYVFFGTNTPNASRTPESKNQRHSKSAPGAKLIEEPRPARNKPNQKLQMHAAIGTERMCRHADCGMMSPHSTGVSYALSCILSSPNGVIDDTVSQRKGIIAVICSRNLNKSEHERFTGQRAFAAVRQRLLPASGRNSDVRASGQSRRPGLLAEETFSRDVFAQVMSHFRWGGVLDSAADVDCLSSTALRIGN